MHFFKLSSCKESLEFVKHFGMMFLSLWISGSRLHLRSFLFFLSAQIRGLFGFGFGGSGLGPEVNAQLFFKTTAIGSFFGPSNVSAWDLIHLFFWFKNLFKTVCMFWDLWIVNWSISQVPKISKDKPVDRQLALSPENEFSLCNQRGNSMFNWKKHSSSAANEISNLIP